MAGTILPQAVETFVDANGKPLAGGSVYMYIPNTTTFKNTWQDPAQTILNTNPIILNASGQAIIWGTGSYRQQVFDANNNLIWDQVTEDTSGGLLGNMVDNTFASGSGFTPGVTTQLTLTVAPGSIHNTWIYFDGVYQADNQIASLGGTTLTFNSAIPSGTQLVTVKIGSTIAIGTPGSGTVTDSSVADGSKLYNRINDWIDVKDFGAKGNGVTDDTISIQNALNTAASSQALVWMPAGTYAISSITIPTGVSLRGTGNGTIITNVSTFSSGNLINIANSAANVDLGNFKISLPLTFTASSCISGTSATYANIHDINVPAGGAFAVNLTSCSNCTVERVNVLSANSIAIQLSSGQWNVIRNCYATGVVLYHHFAIVGEVNSEINGCKSYRVTGAGFGMELTNCAQCRITGCFTQDSIVEGINITDSSNCTVSNNTVRWSTSGISQDFGMSMNASSANCNLNIFANNNIFDPGKSGIAIAASSSAAMGNIVVGNLIWGAGQLSLANDGGILIYGGTGAAINNLVEGNMIYGDGTHTRYGVIESSAYGSTPNNNRIALNSVFNVTVSNVSTVGSTTVSFIPAGW